MSDDPIGRRASLVIPAPEGTMLTPAAVTMWLGARVKVDGEAMVIRSARLALDGRSVEIDVEPWTGPVVEVIP